MLPLNATKRHLAPFLGWFMRELPKHECGPIRFGVKYH